MMLANVVSKIILEVGLYVKYEKYMQILLISTQKSYFFENNATYDAIIQEPVRK